MITGRDLIIYILENGFEDVPIFSNETFIGFYTIEQYAERSGYGVETIKAKIIMGQIEGAVSIGDTYLIAKDMLKGENE